MQARIRCTTQVCTTAAGQTALTAAGRPVSPSQQTIRASRRPRLRSSVSTPDQNFAPSVCWIQMPSTYLRPSRSTPTTRWAALLATTPASRTLIGDRVGVHDRIHRVDRPVLPGGDLLGDHVGDPADRRRADLRAVDLGQVG